MKLQPIWAVIYKAPSGTINNEMLFDFHPDKAHILEAINLLYPETTDRKLRIMNQIIEGDYYIQERQKFCC